MSVFSLNEVKTEQVKNAFGYGNIFFSFWPEGNNFGYYTGGTNDATAPGTRYSDIERLDFSTEISVIPGPNLPAVVFASGTVSNRSYGYVGGGRVGGNNYTAAISRLEFSNETSSALTATTLDNRGYLTATSSPTDGYWYGGYRSPTSWTTLIRKIDFSNETTSPIPAVLPSPSANHSSSSTGKFGYIVGGDSISTILRLDHTTDTLSPIGVNLPGVTSNPTSIQNNTYFSYFGGGVIATYISTVIRLDFSNETITSKGTLPVAKSDCGGTSTLTYGYFGGGYTGLALSTITRYDFSTEVSSNIPDVLRTAKILSGGALSTTAI